jgi:beta-glucosidase
VGSMDDLAHKVVVRNVGSRSSPVVVLAFVVATPDSPKDTPLKRLFGFERINDISPGSNVTVTFVSDASSLSVVTANGSRQIIPGRYRIEIGSVSSPAVRDLILRGRASTVESNDWVESVGRRRPN